MWNSFNFVYSYNVADLLQTSIFQVRNCVRLLSYIWVNMICISLCSVSNAAHALIGLAFNIVIKK